MGGRTVNIICDADWRRYVRTAKPSELMATITAVEEIADHLIGIYFP